LSCSLSYDLALSLLGQNVFYIGGGAKSGERRLLYELVAVVESFIIFDHTLSIVAMFIDLRLYLERS